MLDKIGLGLILVGIPFVLFLREDDDNEKISSAAFTLKILGALATMFGFAILLFLVHKPLFTSLQ